MGVVSVNWDEIKPRVRKEKNYRDGCRASRAITRETDTGERVSTRWYHPHYSQELRGRALEIEIPEIVSQADTPEIFGSALAAAYNVISRGYIHEEFSSLAAIRRFDGKLVISMHARTRALRR